MKEMLFILSVKAQIIIPSFIIQKYPHNYFSHVSLLLRQQQLARKLANEPTSAII